jgi:hypothetical protein
VKPIHPAVLQGRNPWWREAWEALQPPDRKAIKEAMRRGTRVPEDRLLPFIYGLVAIERRTLRWVWIQVVWVEAAAGFWVYFYCFRPPSIDPFCWFFVAVMVLGLAALPVRLALGRRKLQRAEAANLWGRASESKVDGS